MHYIGMRVIMHGIRTAGVAAEADWCTSDSDRNNESIGCTSTPHNRIIQH